MKSIVTKTNRYARQIVKKGKIGANVLVKATWNNSLKWRTFATENLMTKLNSKWLWGGAAIVAAGILINETMSEEPSVDYDKLRADLEELLESAFKTNPMYDDGSYGPVFVRLAWHSAGTYSKHDRTGGSGGANMRFHPEAGHGANAGLTIARDLLEGIKKKYPNISYADLYTFAGVVAIESLGGPKILWRPGRSDTPCVEHVKPTPHDRLPDASQGSQHIRDIFYRMGFDDKEIVALAGAHALGRCHTDRSGFHGPWTRSPTSFTNAYFQELLNNKWTQKKMERTTSIRRSYWRTHDASC